jgi:hypothetical protein
MDESCDDGMDVIRTIGEAETWGATDVGTRALFWGASLEISFRTFTFRAKNKQRISEAVFEL